MTKIIVIFKTHLDVGFTDFAQNVIHNYMDNYLPNAIRVAKQMRGEKEGFIWTVGSWLINKYLEEGKHPELLREAIHHNEVRWHGLPFTTHTELMDAELFQYGLRISNKLDACFGKKTIAAKMTDVPGHTKAMIPFLYQAGLRFLHIGVNPASTRPSVPELFRWKADSGEELVVMYNSAYGKLTRIGESDAAVYFAHTGDNLGPQSPEAIREIYEQLHEEFPDAEICAGTLEDVARIAVLEKNLPVLTDEIGDSWIHGVGTDPRKVSQFRELLRLKNQLSKQDMEKIYREIITVPEHTWGLDEKTHLGFFGENSLYGEHRYFVRSEFEDVRGNEKFIRMEQSWKEQRNYIDNGLQAISEGAKFKAEQAVGEYCREFTDTKGWNQVGVGELLAVCGWKVIFDTSGAICFLEKGGNVLADSDHPMGKFLYEVFSQNEYDRWTKQYVTSEEAWAIEDFGKIGVDQAVDTQKSFSAYVTSICRKESQIALRMELPKEATELYGGMNELEMLLNFTEEEIFFDFAWKGKKANRIPEASWLQFSPRDRITGVQKLGSTIDPSRVVNGGNKHMHGVNEDIAFERGKLKTIDAPLVALGEAWILKFSNEAPKLDQGIWVNLHNNVWGTNFPMWYEDDARFRFLFQVQ